MTAAYSPPVVDDRLTRWAVASAGMHLIVALLLLVELPSRKFDEPPEQAITVEMVPADNPSLANAPRVSNVPVPPTPDDVPAPPDPTPPSVQPPREAELAPPPPPPPPPPAVASEAPPQPRVTTAPPPPAPPVQTRTAQSPPPPAPAAPAPPTPPTPVTPRAAPPPDPTAATVLPPPPPPPPTPAAQPTPTPPATAPSPRADPLPLPPPPAPPAPAAEAVAAAPGPRTDPLPLPPPPAPPPPQPVTTAGTGQTPPVARPQERSTSVLNTLEALRQRQQQEAPRARPNTRPAPPTAGAGAPTGTAQLTQGEVRGLAQQISECWSVDQGMMNIGQMRVSLRLDIDPQGIVRNVRPAEGPYNEPRQRALYESARRAVLDPRCATLRFPPEKLQRLRDIPFNFSPQGFVR
ncbi:hypothetical protein C8P66_116121 [Humitalea rosea]|uniref:Cell division and transport-associated protein TolA n=1 Tax=Humitalea rosea TaxID=990373 RepID=A0A2W7K6Q5_9PROT|nr:hypothetical protein [Humitalea rosea]PZW43200.1 hypothetical protein C8P66_116121 [Humitalea rosea]